MKNNQQNEIKHDLDLTQRKEEVRRLLVTNERCTLLCGNYRIIPMTIWKERGMKNLIASIGRFIVIAPTDAMVACIPSTESPMLSRSLAKKMNRWR